MAGQKGQELFLLDLSHIWMQSLWMVWEQLRGCLLSGSTWFWHMRQSFRGALCREGVGLWMGPGAVLSPRASRWPTCSMSSSWDIPASVPRALFTCCSRDVSCARLHCGNRPPSFSSSLSSLPAGPEAVGAAAAGGGGEGASECRV